MVPCSLSIDSDPRLLGADDPQSAFECAEIHQARQGCCWVAAGAAEVAEHRSVGYRDRHSRRGTSGDFRGVSSARQSRRASGAAAWASVSPSCSAWACCSDHRVRRPLAARQGLRLRHRSRAAHRAGGERRGKRRPDAPDEGIERPPKPARSWSSRTIQTSANCSSYY